jgi:hypothetical protein
MKNIIKLHVYSLSNNGKKNGLNINIYRASVEKV